MLKVDLGELDRKERLSVDEAVPPDATVWEDTHVDLRSPLEVRLEVDRVGSDIVARGTLKGEAVLACRRCLVDVKVHINESVELVYRPEITEAEAQRQEVYVLPERDPELDLTRGIRERVMLAVPQYGVCREACKGICPQCGTNLNETSCDCEQVDVDERWAPLREMKREE